MVLYSMQQAATVILDYESYNMLHQFHPTDLIASEMSRDVKGKISKITGSIACKFFFLGGAGMGSVGWRGLLTNRHLVAHLVLQIGSAVSALSPFQLTF